MRQALLALLLVPLLLAGCLTEATPLDAASAPPPVAEAAAVQEPLHLEGAIGTFVAACPVVTCVFVPVSDSAFPAVPLEGGRTVTSLVATLTWEATSPATEELGFAFATDDGEWKEHAYVHGRSPLTIELSEPIDLSADAEHSLAVFVGSLGPAPVFAVLEQPVVIDGVATFDAPPDGPNP